MPDKTEFKRVLTNWKFWSLTSKKMDVRRTLTLLSAQHGIAKNKRTLFRRRTLSKNYVSFIP